MIFFTLNPVNLKITVGCWFTHVHFILLNLSSEACNVVLCMLGVEGQGMMCG